MGTSIWMGTSKIASRLCIQDTQILRPLCETLRTISGLGTVIAAGDAEDDVLSMPPCECTCLMYLGGLDSMHIQLSKSRFHCQCGQYDIERSN